MQTDPLADFLTQIRNANMASLPEIVAPWSRMKSDVAGILKQEGFIEDFGLEKREEKPVLRVKLRPGASAATKAIRGLQRISKPGLRRYVPAREIPKVLGGLGVAVLSTSRGVLSGADARKQNVGGELLLYVW